MNLRKLNIPKTQEDKIKENENETQYDIDQEKEEIVKEVINKVLYDLFNGK